MRVRVGPWFRRRRDTIAARGRGDSVITQQLSIPTSAIGRTLLYPLLAGQRRWGSNASGSKPTSHKRPFVRCPGALLRCGHVLREVFWHPRRHPRAFPTWTCASSAAQDSKRRARSSRRDTARERPDRRRSKDLSSRSRNRSPFSWWRMWCRPTEGRVRGHLGLHTRRRTKRADHYERSLQRCRATWAPPLGSLIRMGPPSTMPRFPRSGAIDIERSRPISRRPPRWTPWPAHRVSRGYRRTSEAFSQARSRLCPRRELRTAGRCRGRRPATQSAPTIQHGMNCGSGRPSNWRLRASRISCAFSMSSAEEVHGAGSATGSE